MKKLLLSLLVVVGFVFASNAQLLELYHDGELFEMGEKITVIEDPLAFELVAHMTVKNVSNEALVLKCRKIEIEMIPSTSNTFCWGICYAPSVFLSPMAITLNPGESTDEFSGHYMPATIEGLSKMAYSFIPEGHSSDSTYFYVDFHATEGVGITSPDAKSSYVSNPYPNPASSQVSFDYNFPAGTNTAVINIHNLLGAKVKELTISGTTGKTTIDVNDLNDGIYFYSVNIDNEILETKRLVVSR